MVGRPDEAYFGAVGGGLWKTTDGGDNWASVTDFKISSASVGAVAVSESNPDLVFTFVCVGPEFFEPDFFPRLIWEKAEIAP